MMKRIIVFLQCLFLCLLASVPSFAYSVECPSIKPNEGQRYLVVISDLHFGVGRSSNGAWDPTEDFRWSKAFAGFLNRISQCGNNAVDLVIAGDSMELWQPPKEIKCEGKDIDARCTPQQFLEITKIVTTAHKNDFTAIGAFSDKGTNRVYFVPGNHDAALLLPAPWNEVYKTINSTSGRIYRVDTERWVSEDAKVVIEHGHQIGADVNGYAKWPNILKDVDGAQYVESSWGERFVQQLFNEQEVDYSIIDNLSPETAGLRYRMADRGLWKSLDDVAKFIRFNLFETSVAQKVKALGPSEDTTNPPKWDIDFARKKGHQLFTDALPADDPFLLAILSKDEQAAELRSKLKLLAGNETILPDTGVIQICDQMAIRSKGKKLCKKPYLGAALQSLIVSDRAVHTDHVNKLYKEDLKNMRLFIYGHTHQLKTEQSVKGVGPYAINVYNTGAFQRLVDEENFHARTQHLPPSEALKSLTVEDLAPCYTAVVVRMGEFFPPAQTVQWVMKESDEEAAGYFISPGATVCK